MAVDKRLSEGPAWLRNAPGWLYRSPAERQRQRELPFTCRRVRHERWRMMLSLCLLPAATFEVLVSGLDSGGTIGGTVGGIAGRAAVAPGSSTNETLQLASGSCEGGQ